MASASVSTNWTHSTGVRGGDVSRGTSPLDASDGERGGGLASSRSRSSASVVSRSPSAGVATLSAAALYFGRCSAKAATTLNFSEFSAASYPNMAGTADGLDQEVANKSAFMEIQQQAAAGLNAMPHHAQGYQIRSAYSSQQSQHEAFANSQAGRPLGAYPFSMNNSSLNSGLHNSYTHPSHYLASYPTNVGSCGAPCSSPTRDGKLNQRHFYLYHRIETYLETLAYLAYEIGQLTIFRVGSRYAN